ncbi:hypothetical protein ACFZDG_39135 [Kitasatospora xanthocidica]|uniref:hypothetical protein n=1 Tax=Kitasatospora xanthocidica TaxID=83382 RepID=UPI0036E9CEAE
MTEHERYALYRDEAKVLAEIGDHVHAQVGRVTVRLPRAVAQAAVDAWERDDSDGELGEETREQYEVRGQAGELALIGLAISEDGRWEGDEVVVDLHVHSAGAAWLSYAEAAGTAYRVQE